MKTDFYTKTMLTLIALFLAVLSFDNVYGVAVPEAEAQTRQVKWECKTTTFFGATGDAVVLTENPDDVLNKHGWTVVVPFGKVRGIGDRVELFFCGHK